MIATAISAIESTTQESSETHSRCGVYTSLTNICPCVDNFNSGESDNAHSDGDGAQAKGSNEPPELALVELQFE